MKGCVASGGSGYANVTSPSKLHRLHSRNLHTGNSCNLCCCISCMSTPARNFRKSTPPREVVGRSDYGSHGRVVGAVRVFETDKGYSYELFDLLTSRFLLAKEQHHGDRNRTHGNLQMGWWIASSVVGEEQRVRHDDFGNGRKGISRLARLYSSFLDIQPARLRTIVVLVNSPSRSPESPRITVKKFPIIFSSSLLIDGCRGCGGSFLVF